MSDEQGAIPEGMVAWHGGDVAPADWDGGPVLFREGHIGEAEDDSWMIGYGGPGPKPSPYDIIAYTPAADRLTDTGEGKPCDFWLGDCRRCGKRADRDNQQEPCSRPNGPFAPLATPKPPVDAAAMRERCAQACEDQAASFLSPQYATGQPLSSFPERFACQQCADAIRNLPIPGDSL